MTNTENKIGRFDAECSCGNDGLMHPEDNGYYVTYDDHISIVVDKDKKILELQRMLGLCGTKAVCFNLAEEPICTNNS